MRQDLVKRFVGGAGIGGSSVFCQLCFVLGSAEHIRLFHQAAEPPGCGAVYFHRSGTTRAGCNKDHAVSAAGTVDGGSRGVFQDGDGLDVGTVEIGEGIGVGHVSHTADLQIGLSWRAAEEGGSGGSAIQGYAIDDIQGIGVGADGVVTSDLYYRGCAGLAAGDGDLHAWYFTLQELVGGSGGNALVEILCRDGGERS